MKKITLLSFLILIHFSGNAQVTSLNESFDGTCAISGLNYPMGWSEYHKPTTNDLLAWNCSPTFGFGGTGCEQINGYYSATNHLDSAWLITPQLTLSGYSGDISLQFLDVFRFNGDKVALLVSQNYQGGYPDSSIYSWTNVTDSLNPLFDTPDSLGWTTHRISLTRFKAHPLNFAFRYTSSLTACARWNIDNVMTVVSTTAVLPEEGEPQNILVVGTTNKITISFSGLKLNSCNVELYDAIGKRYYGGDVALQNGEQKLIIDGLQLQTGMYFIKLSSSENGFQKVVKAVITSGTVITKQ